MSQWAQTRRTLILLGIFVVLGLIAFAIYTFFFFSPPSCFDNIRNGNEEGIDCGGTCELVCPFQATEPNILWSRAFKISDGVYNIAGLIENPNFDVKLDGTYHFQAYNQDNILISEVFGDVTVLPAQKKPIFEPTINTGFQEISRVFLQMVGESTWTKAEQQDQTVFVTSRKLEDQDTEPKLEVSLVNRGIVPERDLSITAILYDEEGNVTQSSQTFLEYIERDSTESVFYTWPEPFTQEVTKIDVFINEVSLL